MQELKATKVIVMEIEEASAKVRAAGVNDDAADLALPIWAGVIPVKTVLGAPQSSADLPAGTTFPVHLERFRPGRALDDCLLETQAIYEAVEAG
ncbi:hypothetical protein FGG78_32475 [Thioclava sp. BHET1]|nr:hypothetical protein FGG78_32475 [Thioclava sp. BHET1]